MNTKKNNRKWLNLILTVKKQSGQEMINCLYSPIFFCCFYKGILFYKLKTNNKDNFKAPLFAVTLLFLCPSSSITTSIKRKAECSPSGFTTCSRRFPCLLGLVASWVFLFSSRRLDFFFYGPFEHVISFFF